MEICLLLMAFVVAVVSIPAIIQGKRLEEHVQEILMGQAWNWHVISWFIFLFWHWGTGPHLIGKEAEKWLAEGKHGFIGVCMECTGVPGGSGHLLVVCVVCVWLEVSEKRWRLTLSLFCPDSLGTLTFLGELDYNSCKVFFFSRELKVWHEECLKTCLSWKGKQSMNWRWRERQHGHCPWLGERPSSGWWVDCPSKVSEGTAKVTVFKDLSSKQRGTTF